MMRALVLAVVAVLTLVLTFALASLSHALDLGVYGKTYPIREPDFWWRSRTSPRRRSTAANGAAWRPRPVSAASAISSNRRPLKVCAPLRSIGSGNSTPASP
ncbi:MAG: hypothetical protein IPG66_06650 [Hydrogenophilales bacterium]|nr:hypothetical protein [Hydrogenophilales bacterium]